MTSKAPPRHSEGCPAPGSPRVPRPSSGARVYLPADGVRRGGSGVRARPQSSHCQSPPLSASEDEPLAQAARVTRPRNPGPAAQRPRTQRRVPPAELPGAAWPPSRSQHR